MKHCPACSKSVPSIATSCPHCGVNLGAAAVFEELKGDLARTESHTRILVDHLRRVQEKLAALEGAFVPRAPAPEPAAPPPPPLPRAEEPVRRAPAYEPPVQEEEFPESRSGGTEIQLGQKWLLIGGLIITLFGIAYFLKYSFDQNWVGPAGRVALCYLGAAVFLVIGEVCRRGNLQTFGLNLIGGGVASLYLCTYGAFQVWDLLNQATAFLLMILITVFAGVLSLHYDKKALAVLGLVGGFATPFLVSTGSANDLALMTYLTILNLGVIWISFHKRWDLLNQLGFFFTWALFAGFYSRYHSPDRLWVTLGFANVFFLIYALAPFLYYFARTCDTATKGIWITVPNSFLGFGYSYHAIKGVFGTYPSAGLSLGYAVIFFLLARHLYRRNPGSRPAIVLMLAKAMLFLVLTVPLLFSKHWITVFWAVQALTILWAGLKLENRYLRGGAFALGVLCLVKLFCYDWPEVFRTNVHGITLYVRSGFGFMALERWITHGVVALSMFLAARICGNYRAWKERIGIATVNGLAVFLMLHLEVGAYFHENLPEALFAAISVYWALFSIVAMIFGFIKNVAALRKCAIGLFAITVFKVSLFDMANVSTPFRVLSFIVLGLLLIAASFLYYRFRDRITEGTR